MSRRRGGSPTGEEVAEGSGDEGRGNRRNFDEDNAIPTHYEELPPPPPPVEEVYEQPQPEYYEPSNFTFKFLNRNRFATQTFAFQFLT